ncbi:FlgD immunoglobulin-like domain containing protein [Gemmatimonadota bacterium]
MKIIKILFLGIVLVLFNLAYLAAQELPDSVSVNFSSAEPGGVLTVTVDVRFYSSTAGGFILIAQGLPEGLVTTAEGVDLDGGTMPTGDGTWAYEWTDGYGKVLAAQSLNASVLIDPEAGTLTTIILGANVATWSAIPPPLGIDPAAVGPIAMLHINVPAAFAEGTYDLELADGGLSIQPFPADGAAIEGVPYFSTNSIVVAEIPDANSLEMVANLGATSGGTAVVSVMVANKDSIGSGSFKLGYTGSVMMLDSVVAGVRAGEASFDLDVADSSTALAAEGKIATVTISDASIGIGGLGELCKLYFDVAPVGAGTMASVMLGSVDLNDPSGADVPDLVQPTTASTAIEFSFGDTLSLAEMTGEGTATIIDGQLHVPIVLTNASAVSGVSFYISEPAGMEDILSLSSEIAMHYDRAVGWTVLAADSGSYVQVISYAPTEGSSVAAGTGQLFHVVFDINTAAFTVPAFGETTVDLVLGLLGVELTSSTGTLLGVEAMGDTASLDFRVPNDGEGVGPGASLPKAFSLRQNHPNPFNPSTTINYQIPDNAGSVQFRLNVYDIRGKLVRTLDQGLKGAGTYSVFWDGTDDRGRQVSSGVYFYRFVSSEYNATRKMIMLK